MKFHRENGLFINALGAKELWYVEEKGDEKTFFLFGLTISEFGGGSGIGLMLFLPFFCVGLYHPKLEVFLRKAVEVG